jgi:uncharacterized protein YndB with AHSA1/START domain
VEIATERLVDASTETVFAFLSDLDKHWLLADRSIELVSLEVRGGVRQGGTVRLQGPLGLHRTANTRVLDVSPPHRLVGSAEVGRRTRALVRWILAPHGNRTAVRLSATVVSLALPDRLLFAAGGERWLRARFAATIARLAQEVAPQAGVRPRATPSQPPRLALPAAWRSRVVPKVSRTTVSRTATVERHLRDMPALSRSSP